MRGRAAPPHPGIYWVPPLGGSLWAPILSIPRTQQLTALHANQWNFDKKVTLLPQAVEELEWWANNVIDSYNVLTRESPNRTLTTDASMEGWGAVFGTRSTGGLWAHTRLEITRGNHINYLELLAAFLYTHIWLMIDYTTAVAVINHMGTCHSDVLNTLSKRLRLWCVSCNIWISAAHIAGKSNQQADLESHIGLPQARLPWMLFPLISPL